MKTLIGYATAHNVSAPEGMPQVTNRAIERRKHEYELDDRGNWIKRKTFNLKDRVPVPSSVTYRTITYYE